MSEVAEITAEVVEDSIDGVVETLEVVRNNPVALAAVGLVGVVAGGVGGYFVARKVLKRYYEDLVETEIAEAKAFYANVYKTDPDGAVLTPQEVLGQRHGAEAAAEALQAYQGRKATEHILSEDEQDEVQMRKIEERLEVETVEEEDGTIRTTEVQESRNVFIDPNFDMEEELKYRTPETPYIITHDEYFENEGDYEQVSLTYFEMDDTLTNEKDEPQREIDKLIGEDHLVRFGHGSKDRNIVYVRNERLETDFEIIKSNGSYLEEVLGIADDEPNSLKHSDQRDRRRAFRHGDG